MRLPIEWLKDYVDVDITPEELAHKLTMAGITIEGIERLENDTILDLDLTPNRGDCYGIINVAREVAAVTGAPLHLPQSTPDENEEKIEDSVSVTIKDSDLCRRYAARLVRNIRLAPSPSWMRERLENSGIRAINNIVDVTNYVMLETNQPLHAFDYDLLKNGSIVVRRAQKGEKIDTLDGQEREIDQDTLIIADNERPVALAGVMGGANSEINDSTITVLLESANFDGVSIRKTSKKVGLRTESSIRFEKGVDIEGVIFAVDRAARLIEILGAGEVVKGVIDAYPAPQEPRLITLRPARVNHVLGTNLSENEIVAYLRQLDFEVEPSGEQFLVSVPSYRPDLEIEEDLIEEVARLYGYDNIPTSLTRGTPTQGHLDGYQAFQDRVVDVISRWMRQVVTYSFINPRWLDTLMVPQEDELRNTLVIANPFSDEQGIMRTTLVPGLFDAMNRNLARRNEDLAIFELGNVFRPCQKGLPDEVLMLGGIVVGKTNPGWQGKT
ncbi:MAG: phenylalanine--tRNA ligase subunit beta, partial [Chitinophagales bacterium]